MAVIAFCPPRETPLEIAASDLGNACLTFDDVLLSGTELGLEEDSAGHLVLIESDESE